VIGQIVQQAQRRFDFPGEHHPGELQQLALRREPKHGQHVRLLDPAAAKANQLVERRFRVPHRALSPARNRVERGRRNLDFLQIGDVREVLGNQRRRNPPQVEPLTARQDGGQHLLRVGRGEHELHMRRRFFEGLEQRVESPRGQHVNFVYDVNLEAGAGRRILARLAQLANLLDAVVAGAVNLEDVQRTPFGDFPAARVVFRKLHPGPALAIKALGENAGDGRFAGPARPAEQVGMGNALLLQGARQRLRDVLLPHHIPEPLRAILASNDLITHVSAAFGAPERGRKTHPPGFLIPPTARRILKLNMPG